MSHNGAIQLICFDLGGVLIRICRSWEEGCRAAGLELRGPIVDDPSCANGRRDISQRYQTGRMTCEEYFRTLSAAVKNLYAPHEIERIHHAWLLSEYPGVGAVIDHIHQAGLRTAALSNTNHSHWSRMTEFPAVMKLQHRLASHELGVAKPDEAIYHEAERRWGVKGANILFFDDLPDNIDTARRVGWRTVAIDPAGPTDQQITAALRDHRVIQ